MRPKLYLAVDTVTVMFVCEEGKDLYEAARRFADEEHKHYVPGRLAIKEIKTIEEIPKDWSGGQLLWGIDEEITARDFIEDPEYEEYKRLKEKFEK